MKVLVTGANGFIGKNLLVHLRENKTFEIFTHTKNDSLKDLQEKVLAVEFIFHLAGINRPKNEIEFTTGNTDLTIALCQAIEASGKKIPVIFSSSSQAALDNPYGKSKSQAEDALRELSRKSGMPVYIFRLPNVFGKWCKPNYNSVVATFCHNIIHDLPVKINDPKAQMRLVYIDDVIESFLKLTKESRAHEGFQEVHPVYELTVGELEQHLRNFKASRETLVTERVGVALIRALYSTYISYFSPEHFSYPLVAHVDPRGMFVEMLKTKDSGQFSFFTAKKGITRGGHYHHSKTEKFLVLKGEARFGFRQIDSNELYEVRTSGNIPVIVETIPGWAHDITNVGEDEMIVMLWANEIFDPENPDTISQQV